MRFASFPVAYAILYSTCVPLAAKVHVQPGKRADATEIASPRLAQLQGKLKAGQRETLDEFWREVQANGTPLIEPIMDDPKSRLVTFLWRSERDTTVVLLA